jgi:hypothetical protein
MLKPFTNWTTCSLQFSGIALGYGINDRWFESRQGLGIFLLTTASRLAPEPTQPPIQCVLGVLSVEIKRPGREVELVWSSRMRVVISPLPNTPTWRSAQLKHRDNFTFTPENFEYSVLRNCCVFF